MCRVANAISCLALDAIGLVASAAIGADGADGRRHTRLIGRKSGQNGGYISGKLVVGRLEACGIFPDLDACFALITSFRALREMVVEVLADFGQLFERGLHHRCIIGLLALGNSRHRAEGFATGLHFLLTHFLRLGSHDGGGTERGDQGCGKNRLEIHGGLLGYDKFKADFVAAGTTQFGSGWAWLSVKDGKLVISKTPNGENPLVHGASPILGVDVWEHSYYIDYRNARPKYLEAFVDSLINWDYVAELYEAATK